ncbi:hypothetical protein F4859DRAFT_216936 [Xylaria cf. heliscus]|nr:hypothetical protein F4859DRAFT_216936 [Xylaria cf. heliscus]
MSCSPSLQPRQLPKESRTRRHIEGCHMAANKNCTSAQLTPAWVMAQGPDLSPTTGTKNVKHLEQNVGSVNVEVNFEEDKHIREVIERMGGASGSRQVAQSNALADTPKLN